MQIRKNKKGGCWQHVYSAKSTKQIGAFESNLLWSQTFFNEQPINTISVYMPSHIIQETELVIRNLIWMIHSIFSANYNAKLIITGDFNKDHLPITIVKKYKLQPVIPEGLSAHITKTMASLLAEANSIKFTQT